MNLVLKSDTEMMVPTDLVHSTLTLAEIGAVICFFAMENGEVSEPRFASEEMKKAVEALKAKGVFNASLEKNELKISINLDPVLPPE